MWLLNSGKRQITSNKEQYNIQTTKTLCDGHHAGKIVHVFLYAFEKNPLKGNSSLICLLCLKHCEIPKKYWNSHCIYQSFTYINIAWLKYQAKSNEEWQQQKKKL